MKILYVPFLLFACQLLLTTATGSYYLTTRDSKNDSMPNLYKLQCRSQPIPQDEHDGMKWLFNGSNYTMSSCFAGAVLNENTLTFNHSSDCDGYIQCGDGTEYSHPFKLIGMTACIITLLKFCLLMQLTRNTLLSFHQGR